MPALRTPSTKASTFPSIVPSISFFSSVVFQFPTRCSLALEPLAVALPKRASEVFAPLSVLMRARDREEKVEEVEEELGQTFDML